MDFKHIFQPNGSSCFGAVAAMACKQDFSDVIKKIGHDGFDGYGWKEIMLCYLMRCCSI